MLKLIIRILKKIFCKHNERLASFFPDKENTYWSYNDKPKGHISGIVFRCCLKCKKVWVENYME